jgi:hypothetical protein
MENTFSMQTTQLEFIKNYIEKLNKQHQLEILKILKKDLNIKINENKNGIFINLSLLSNELLNEILIYINYIKDQEKTLNVLETEKETYKLLLH